MGPPWDAFGSRPRKTTKRSLSGLPFWVTILTYFLTFLMLIFVSFLNLSPTSFWRQRHPQTSISKGVGRHLEHILNKCGKVETAIPCGMVLKNQALEGLCLTLFCHFHLQVFGTSFFHDSFDDLSPFYTCASIGSQFFTTCCKYFDHHSQARKKYKKSIGDGISSGPPAAHQG